jgi:hypothetical protein
MFGQNLVQRDFPALGDDRQQFRPDNGNYLLRLDLGEQFFPKFLGFAHCFTARFALSRLDAVDSD